MERVEPPQIIYVLVNEAMPGLVKVGRTASLESRMASLNNSTSVPIPFTCAYASRVDDALYIERQLHSIFAGVRVSPKREFFRVSPESVIAALELVEVETVYPGASNLKLVESDARASPTFNPDAFSREQAEKDVIEMLEREDAIPSQSVLVSRWGVNKSCVSKWVDTFCEKGILERFQAGRHIMLIRPGLSGTIANESGLQDEPQAALKFPECSVHGDGDSLSNALP